MADLTPNNREEHWLQGMVDGQTTLEPNKRREYWYKEIVDAIGSGGGGGGTGGGVLKVGFQDPTAENPILDKTWQEIYEAASGGSVVTFCTTTVIGPETTHTFEPLIAVFEVDNEGSLLYGVNFFNYGPFNCGSPNDYPETNYQA